MYITIFGTLPYVFIIGFIKIKKKKNKDHAQY